MLQHFCQRVRSYCKYNSRSSKYILYSNGRGNLAVKTRVPSNDLVYRFPRDGFDTKRNSVCGAKSMGNCVITIRIWFGFEIEYSVYV